tara:strand:+ start:105 stop:284 length:180 start_codon:yes stop_codon:yes gene_type:complete
MQITSPPIRNGSPQMNHIISIIERFGNNARYPLSGRWYYIRDAKPHGPDKTVLILESVL